MYGEGRLMIEVETATCVLTLCEAEDMKIMASSV